MQTDITTVVACRDGEEQEFHTICIGLVATGRKASDRVNAANAAVHGCADGASRAADTDHADGHRAIAAADRGSRPDWVNWVIGRLGGLALERAGIDRLLGEFDQGVRLRHPGLRDQNDVVLHDLCAVGDRAGGLVEDGASVAAGGLGHLDRHRVAVPGHHLLLHVSTATRRVSTDPPPPKKTHTHTPHTPHHTTPHTMGSPGLCVVPTR